MLGLNWIEVSVLRKVFHSYFITKHILFDSKFKDFLLEDYSFTSKPLFIMVKANLD